MRNLPTTGIKSAYSSSNGLILGDAVSGKIYNLENKVITLICQSGDQEPVNNIITLSDGNSLASIGGKLDVILSKKSVQEVSNSFSSISNTVSIGNSITILDLGEETITDMIEIWMK